MNDRTTLLIEKIKEQQRLLKHQLDTEQSQLSDLAKRIWAQQEAEKAKLSRDLHDGVGQILTGLTRKLQQLTSNMPEYAELLSLSEMALADIRSLSRLMSPTILQDLGLNAAISWLCRSMFEHEDIDYECDINIDIPLDPELNILIFRITQEALTNIAKHANAKYVKLFVSCHHQTLRLDIIDDGKGFEIDNTTKGIGLTSLQDRAKAFNAELVIQSHVNKGTHISMVIPV
ncbi:MAG: two-component system NarL family sensor kinase [Glaciecola sp.]|jgi:two-component system NarL family sensor kinase